MPTKKRVTNTAPKKAGATALKEAKVASETIKKAADSNVTFLNTLPNSNFFKMEMDMMKPNKQFEKLSQDANAMGQEQMDAMMKSTAIFQKGMEEIIKISTQIVQEASEKNATATKSLMACKTLNELADVQSKLAQSSYDTFLSNATKLSELSVKLCTDSFAPINDQVGKAVKKASSAAA